MGTIPLAAFRSVSTLTAILGQAGQHQICFAFKRPLLEKAALMNLTREEAIWFVFSGDSQFIRTQLHQGSDVWVTNGAALVR